MLLFTRRPLPPSPLDIAVEAAQSRAHLAGEPRTITRREMDESFIGRGAPLQSPRRVNKEMRRTAESRH